MAPASIESWLALAQVHFRLGRTDRVRAVCDKIGHIAPDNTWMVIFRGMADAADGNPRLGLDRVRKDRIGEENLHREDFLTARAYLATVARQRDLAADSMGKLQRYASAKSILSSVCHGEPGSGGEREGAYLAQKGVAAREWGTVEVIGLSTVVAPVRHNARFPRAGAEGGCGVTRGRRASFGQPLAERGRLSFPGCERSGAAVAEQAKTTQPDSKGRSHSAPAFFVLL